MATKAMPIQLANAIVAMLGEEDFSLAFTAKRRHLPYDVEKDSTTNELEKINGVAVLVVVGGFVEIIREDRDTIDHGLVIDIGIYSKLVQDPLKETTEVDELLKLAEEIQDAIEAARLTTEDGDQGLLILPVQRDVWFSAPHLDQQRLFLTALKATYKVPRSDPGVDDEDDE